MSHTQGRKDGGRECGLHLCSLHRIYISPISSVFIAFLLICFYFPSSRREGVERDGDCGYLAEGKEEKDGGCLSLLVFYPLYSEGCEDGSGVGRA